MTESSRTALRGPWQRGGLLSLGNQGVWAAIAASVVFFLAGCGETARRDREPEKPVVVVSVLPQANFVERVAGDLVDVQVMIPPGASPALYEPTIQQMQAMSRAAIYVKVGHPHFPFEKAWLDTLLEENASLNVVDGSEGAPRKTGDPHVWVSPGCVRVMARNLEAALEEVLPEHREQLQANLDLFLKDIDRLDADIRKILAGHAGEKFLVFHPAWGYFADEYGLVQVAIEHHAHEPSPSDLAHLIEEAREEDVKVIFVQPQFSQESARRVAEQIGGRVVAVDPLARDWMQNLKRVAEAFRQALES